MFQPVLDDRSAEARYGRGNPPVLELVGGENNRLAETIHAALQSYPYHVVLRMTGKMDATATVRAVLETLSHERRVSFTRVRIDPDAAAKPSRGTRYSRTNLPLTFHTDTAHSHRPHSLVAFQMLLPDAAGGGRSMIVTAKAVIDRLETDDVAALRAPRFDFGKGPVPIIWGPNASPSFRYYRTQIDAQAAVSLAPMPHDWELLGRLDEVLQSFESTNQFALHTGDVLFVNNHKALHARTGFASASQRSMLRYRLRVDSLE